MRRALWRLAAPALTLLLGACANGPATRPQDYPEPVFPAARILPEKIEDAAKVYDPWEPMNRRIYNFNYHFDQWVFLPVVHGYQTVVPRFARTGIHNFFENFRDMRSMLNAILQGSAVKFFQSTGRVLVNSTLGVLGFIDVAGMYDMPRPQEDFGQTLGYWGVGQGPYLVLPFYGPTNLRDGIGLLPDTYVQTQLQDELFSKPLRATAWIFDSIDTRTFTSFRYYETGSAFEYQTVRWLWSTKRKLDVEK